MGETLDWLNAWFASHQALAVSVGVPVVTSIAAAIVALITSYFNLKASAKDRNLQAKLRVHESKAKQIESLRSVVARFESMAFFAAVDFKLGLSSGQPETIPSDQVLSFVKELTKIMAEISLLIDPQDADSQKLQNAMAGEVLAVGGGGQVDTTSTTERFLPIAKRILGRLEADAESYLAS